ncbi:MAG: SRPBCC domain-containing protein [bacterium]|nr:SRPBCC domain-containing protein [bacterium]
MSPDRAGSSQTKDLTIERMFDAPPELVWKAWTEPEHIMRWWGPKDFTSPACTVDLRVGGKYLFCMESPEGQQFWSTGTYQEIVPQQRLVYTDSFSDREGNIVPATYYGMSEDFPLQQLVTITFEAQGDRTKMTLTHRDFPVGNDAEMAEQGWNESLDKLAASLR